MTTTIQDFKTHAAAFQKSTSRDGTTIEPQEARVLARLYAELPKDGDRREVRRAAIDQPELMRVLQQIDPKAAHGL